MKQVLLLMLALVTLPTGAALVSLPLDAPLADAGRALALRPTPERQESNVPPALDAYFGVSNVHDVRAVHRALLSHFERAQLLPAGALDAFDQEAPEGDEPLFRFRWALGTNDLNGDGVDDLFVNELDLLTFHVRVQAISGHDGTTVFWTHEGGLAFEVLYALGVPGYRPGLPYPTAGESLKASRDVTGDNLDDALVFNLELTWVLPQVVERYTTAQVILVTASIEALDGRNGASHWKEDINGFIAYEFLDPTLLVYHNVPSGWLVYATADGPRVLYKTTDILITVLVDPLCVVSPVCTGFYVADVQITEHLKLMDARDKSVVWARDLNASDDPNNTVITWITGVADLANGDEPELVLDQLLLKRPIFQDGYTHPITGDPLYQRGLSIHARALDGANGLDLWTVTVFDEDAVRVNLAEEEAFPVYWFHHAQILQDATGDGRPDPIVEFLTVDSTSPGTVNGMFRTHFALLDGNAGRLLFDRKYQGWGFATSLSTPDHDANLIAIATTDYPTQAASQGKFPLKEVHEAVLEVPSGRQVWEYSDRFAQDTNIIYDMTLNQYLFAIAGDDWTGDGVRDILAPAHYNPPSGQNQTLLSTTSHRYALMDGATGEVIRTIEAWGPMGFVTGCDLDADGFTVLSGHARRWDLTRFNVHTGTFEWRRPVYFDDRPRPATAGVNLVLIGAHCDDADDRVLFSLNTVTRALGRENNGWETPTVLGNFAPTGDVRWIDPAPPPDVPLVSFLEEPIDVNAATWWASPDLLLIPASILPGAVIGVALRVANQRRNGRGGPK